MTYIATLQQKTPSPDSHIIYDLDRPFLGHVIIAVLLNLFNPCPRVDEKRRRNIACSLNDQAPAQQSLPCGS